MTSRTPALLKHFASWLSKHTHMHVHIHTLTEFSPLGKSLPSALSQSLWPGAQIRSCVSCCLNCGAGAPRGLRVERVKFAGGNFGYSPQKKKAEFQKQQESTLTDLKCSPLLATWVEVNTLVISYVCISHHPAHPQIFCTAIFVIVVTRCLLDFLGHWYFPFCPSTKRPKVKYLSWGRNTYSCI